MEQKLFKMCVKVGVNGDEGKTAKDTTKKPERNKSTIIVLAKVGQFRIML